MSDHREQPRAQFGRRPGWCERGIWAVLAAGEPAESNEIDALRWRILNQWMELHDLKCRCSLDLPMSCRLPVPPELNEWLNAAAQTTAQPLRVVAPSG